MVSEFDMVDFEQIFIYFLSRCRSVPEIYVQLRQRPYW
jgi:hypothetical protein